MNSKKLNQQIAQASNPVQQTPKKIVTVKQIPLKSNNPAPKIMAKKEEITNH